MDIEKLVERLEFIKSRHTDLTQLMSDPSYSRGL